MIESPAYRALSLQARKIMRRLEIEHCAHGGAENGRLPCTYDDFVKYGCWRKGISLALVEAWALGFLQIVSIGKRPFGEIPGRPSTYRLTYLHSHDRSAATNEWKKIDSIEMAKEAVDKAMAEHEVWLNTDAMSPRVRYRTRNKNKSLGVKTLLAQGPIHPYRKRGA